MMTGASSEKAREAKIMLAWQVITVEQAARDSGLGMVDGVLAVAVVGGYWLGLDCCLVVNFGWIDEHLWWIL